MVVVMLLLMMMPLMMILMMMLMMRQVKEISRSKMDADFQHELIRVYTCKRRKTRQAAASSGESVSDEEKPQEGGSALPSGPSFQEELTLPILKIGPLKRLCV